MRRILAMRSSKIAAVRGLGMLVGIEFRDPESAHRFVAATIARGVIVNWTLNAENGCSACASTDDCQLRGRLRAGRDAKSA